MTMDLTNDITFVHNLIKEQVELRVRLEIYDMYDVSFFRYSDYDSDPYFNLRTSVYDNCIENHFCFDMNELVAYAIMKSDWNYFFIGKRIFFNHSQNL